MNFNQFVFKNTWQRKQLYLAYFLSAAFAVMIFFTFTLFANHPALEGKLNQHIQKVMTGSAIVIYGFSFFFVLYSMSVFLQSRKKEFGILMIQGMSSNQLKRMVRIENLFIGLAATIGGTLLGFVFAQVILWIATGLLRVNFGFYFPAKALVITLGSFVGLFLLISILIPSRLPKLSIQKLLKAEELGKGTIKTSNFQSLLAVVLIGLGYAVALFAKGQLVVTVIVPAMLVIFLGTYFLFQQFSLFLIVAIKKRPRLFWKKFNLVVFSDLLFRMKDNARSFFLVASVSTITFISIGTLAAFQEMLLDETNHLAYDFAVAATGDPAMIADAEAIFQTNHLETKKTQVPVYGQGQQKYILASDYNQAAKVLGEPLIVASQTAVQLKNQQIITQEPVKVASVQVQQQELPVTDQVVTEMIHSNDPIFVISDGISLGTEPQIQTMWKITSGSEKQQIAAGNELKKKYRLFQTIAYERDQTIKIYAPMLFVGVFIGIVFFVAAGNFLYFRLYTDFDYDRLKYAQIHKIGLAKKELKQMIQRQVGILFLTPMVVALVHGYVGLTSMYHIFGLNMRMIGWQILLIFSIIQGGYYFIAREIYFKKIYRSLSTSEK